MEIKRSFNSNLLQNKRIIVAGGSSGIGASFAHLASNLGAILILVGRDKNKLKSTIDSLKKNDNEAHSFFSCDLSSFDGSNDFFNKMRTKFSPLDGIVWSAGKELIKNSRIVSNKDIIESFGVSTFGFLGAVKSFSSKRFWNKNGGSVVIISSIASKKGQPGMTVYSASKASYLGIISPLAKELSSFNTRVNMISLGAVETQMHSRILSHLTEEAISEYRDKHLFGFGQTEDVTPMITYLLSGLSKWITGTNIVIDGGYCVNT